MARNVERCTECKPAALCRRHQDCLDHRDAWIAAELGRAWATRVWHGFDIRRPWPTFDGRCAAKATRLVAWLTCAGALARRRELAEICSWSAGMRWEKLQCGARDRPYREAAERLTYALPGHAHVVLSFARAADASELGAWAERCADCSDEPCSRHAACHARWDARLAAEVGVGWALHVWHASDSRAAWPAFADRCAVTARHLVAWLARRQDDAHGDELAAICSWRAGIRWRALLASESPRAASPASGTLEYALPGAPVRLRFRAPHRERVVPLASAALEHGRERALRYREAQGLQPLRARR